MMMADAQKRAVSERIRLDQLLESEKEKLVDIKQELKSLRDHITQILTGYQEQIDEVVENIEDNQNYYINEADNECAASDDN